MIIIRLARHGAKKRPFYKIVVTDKRNARNGNFIERLGFFNPIAVGQEKKICLKINRIESWIRKGAQLSNKVIYLLKKNKNID
ncbi:MAG: 30S ribosomal protein S16 [Candidatus Dasytiphilus stammeri]